MFKLKESGNLNHGTRRTNDGDGLTFRNPNMKTGASVAHVFAKFDVVKSDRIGTQKPTGLAQDFSMFALRLWKQFVTSSDFALR